MRIGKHALTRIALTSMSLIVLLLVVATPARAAGNTVLDVAYHDGACMTWVRAVNSTHLTSLFTLHGPFTVFVPSDSAFAALPPAERERVFANNTALRQLLLYHAVPEYLLAADLRGRSTVTTALGEPLRLEQRDGALWLNGYARVVASDQLASNGVVHMVDAVLLPPQVRQTLATPRNVTPGSLLALLAADDRFDTFVSDIVTAGLQPLLNSHGPFTVFAPTDDAYAALTDRGALLANHRLLRQMLLYHLVPGAYAAADLGGVSALATAAGRPLALGRDSGALLLDGRARVTAADLRATNGVLHAIDTPLRPTAGAFDNPQPRPTVNRIPNNVLQVMDNDPQLSQFVTRLEYAGLENLLTQHGPFTVFAPTNAAIAALPPEFTCVCMENHTRLKALMLFHLVPGRYTAAQLDGLRGLRTALGETLDVAVDADGVLLDGSARLVVRDVPAANGVIHVIDVVLRPAGR